MNRIEQFKKAIPYIIKAANNSPPIEICILDYSSTDGLADYLDIISSSFYIDPKNFITILHSNNHKYYNSPHARNITALHSCGEFIIQLSAEALPSENAFSFIRYQIETQKPIWMCEGYLGRWIVCEREEFIDSGGYDERFIAYAPEDKDICLRLHRRGGKFIQFPYSLIDEIPTSNKDKLANYDLTPYTERLWVKRQMGRIAKKIYEENNKKGVLVANEGIEWGKL
jgi:hypothetical protein